MEEFAMQIFITLWLNPKLASTLKWNRLFLLANLEIFQIVNQGFIRTHSRTPKFQTQKAIFLDEKLK